MPERLAVVPGSFDPITLGHLDVIERAAALFGQVIVAVAANAAKQTLFPPATRLDLVRDCVAGLAGARAEIVPGLLAAFCQSVGASVIVKGARGGQDWSHEAPMAIANRQLAGLETVFLLAAPAWGHISSSLVKDIARHGGDVSPYVPPAVRRALSQRLG
ncbi:MAG: pantetheine-phosphate adenylyltransferase [Bifidobacteriaceae bacterium]|jgi:pantetheine-phosphate adenylyltransferase|nr:pantetheine-phosphate adenylyltransferase [Bifidobacteriaceae bacterium]